MQIEWSLKITKSIVFEKNDRGWQKKDKKIDWSFNKIFFQESLRKDLSYLNQSTIERLLLMHGQINLNKFVELGKFDKVYSKIWTIFVWSNFLKIWNVLIHQISWMRNIKSNFESPQRRKDEEKKTTNESTWNIFVARFSFGVLSSLIFVIYFVI